METTRLFMNKFHETCPVVQLAKVSKFKIKTTNFFIKYGTCSVVQVAKSQNLKWKQQIFMIFIL